MCEKAVDDSLAALKLIPNWFDTTKMIKELFTALYADENILYFNEDSANVTFSCKEMDVRNMDLNKITLDNNIDEDDPDTILLFISDFWLGILNLKNVKHLKKMISEELMQIVQHPKRWWNFCMSEGEKKNKTDFY